LVLLIAIEHIVQFFCIFDQNHHHPMKFEIEDKDKVTVIRTKVEKLDAIHAPELKSEIVLINKEGKKNIVMDLSETRYIDSSGLSAVLVANRLCRDSNGSFVMCGLQASVQKLITISQLDPILKITPTLNEAIDLVYMEEVERDI
jgi:anti-sigma B factor antagonist